MRRGRWSQESRLLALELQRPTPATERRCPACGSVPIPAHAPREDATALRAKIAARLERLAPAASVVPARPVTVDTYFPRCATCGRRRAVRSLEDV